MGKEMTGISQLASMKDPNDIRKQSSLLLFRKQSGLSLVEELVARGGETEKYNLFPPSGQQ